MPFQLRPSSFYSPAATHIQKSFFHSGAIHRDSRQPNHYETLQIPTNASAAEVKKSFYTLSKAHHPDLHPDDPNASKRFVAISEAYNILGSLSKRQRYDAEFLPRLHQYQASFSRPTGSYSSTSPAGGRPASGLSKRRTQFRGPPPSSYRSGGWGEHSEKRQKAQGESTPGREAPPNYSSQNPGMGPGQGFMGEEVPHFDRLEHLRTQENHDRRQRSRRSDPWAPVEENLSDKSTLWNFLFVVGVVLLGASLPLTFAGRLMDAGNGGRRNKREE